MVQIYQEAIHHNCFLRIIKEKKKNTMLKIKKIIFKSFKWSTEMPLEGLDVERQILKIIPSCRQDQKQKNEGKGKKNERESKPLLTRQRKVPP